MTVIEQVARYLAENDLGTLGTEITYSFMPDEGRIGVFDTGGPKPDIDLPTKVPTFQVFIKSTTYDAGKAILDSVRELLHNKYNLYLVSGQTYFYLINALSEGGYIGRNPETGYDEFSINFQTKTR